MTERGDLMDIDTHPEVRARLAALEHTCQKLRVRVAALEHVCENDPPGGQGGSTFDPPGLSEGPGSAC